MRSSMFKGLMLACGLAAVMPGLQSASHADVVARRGGWVIVTPVVPNDTSVNLVNRSVVLPAATISRGLSEQPVRPFMAEVQVVSQTTYIDPTADYRHTGPGTLDENHWILRAQRDFNNAHADTTAYVIVGDRNQPMVRRYEPTMIMMRPNLLPRQNNTPGPIPNAPIETKKPGQVASAQ